MRGKVRVVDGVARAEHARGCGRGRKRLRRLLGLVEIGLGPAQVLLVVVDEVLVEKVLVHPLLKLRH